MLSILKSAVVQFNIVLWIIAFFIYRKTNQKRYLFLVYVIFVLNEVMHYFTGFDLYHPHRRTQLFYDSSDIGKMFPLPDRFANVSDNFTEGHYKSKKCTSANKDEINRFKHFVEIMQIQPGDKVLDLGCGWGNLVTFLRNMGVEAYGLTISNQQYQNNVANHGPYFYIGDYTKEIPQLKGRFDHIIMAGTLEHPFGGNPKFLSTYKNKYSKLSDMFSIIKFYFAKNSTKKRLLSTTIHSNPKFINSKEYYIMERMYGGCYPLISEYSVADSLKKSGFQVTLNKDYTWHYYYSSFCNVSHFGNPINLTSPTILLMLIIYPATIYFYIYFTYGYWMWMWDGKHHFQRNHDRCAPKKGCDLSFEKDINKRPATLFYTIAQLK